MGRSRGTGRRARAPGRDDGRDEDGRGHDGRGGGARGGPGGGPPGAPSAAGPPEPPDDYAARSADLFRAPVRTADGERLGRVSAVLAGPDGAPRWLVVATGLLRSADVPVPVEGCVLSGSTVVVPHARDVVLGAPRLDPDRAADPQLEVGVRLHYAAAVAARRGGQPGQPPRTAW